MVGDIPSTTKIRRRDPHQKTTAYSRTRRSIRARATLQYQTRFQTWVKNKKTRLPGLPSHHQVHGRSFSVYYSAHTPRYCIFRAGSQKYNTTTTVFVRSKRPHQPGGRRTNYATRKTVRLRPANVGPIAVHGSCGRSMRRYRRPHCIGNWSTNPR